MTFSVESREEGQNCEWPGRHWFRANSHEVSSSDLNIFFQVRLTDLNISHELSWEMLVLSFELKKLQFQIL